MVTSWPSRKQRVQVPSEPGTSLLRRRMLANVPRTITSWLPRRAPYELKSLGLTPLAIRYCAAGDFCAIDPAGEMWSVVTLSPSHASTRTPLMGPIGAGCFSTPPKNDGSRTYVLSSFHAYRSEPVLSIEFHISLPLNTSL